MERPRKGPLLFFSRGRAPTRRRRGLGRFYSFANVKSSACASRGWGLLAGAGCDLLQGWGGLSPYPARHTGPGRLGQGVKTPLGRGGLDSGARPPPPQRRRGGQAQVPRASSQNSQAGRAGTVSEAAGTDAPRLGILSGCGSFLPRGRARAAAGRKGQRGGQRRVPPLWGAECWPPC